MKTVQADNAYRITVSVLIFWLAALFSEQIRAADEEKITGPVLIVLMVGNDDESRRRNERFVLELKLALDGFYIKRIQTGFEDFLSLPMNERLMRIRPFVDEFDAVAATWIEESGSDSILLNLVALSTGRALVRIVAARSGPETETELALAAQELLGEAYLFSPGHEEEAVNRVVTRVKEVVVKKQRGYAGPRLGLMPLLNIKSGLWGQMGPSFMAGSGIGMEIWPHDDVYLQARFEYMAGPRERPSDGIVTGFRLAPSISAGYSWKISSFRLGPFVSVDAVYSLADMSLGTGNIHTFDWWNFRGSAGIDLRWRAFPAFTIALDPGVGFYALRRKFTRLSDGSVIFMTPRIDWDLSIKFIFFL